MRRALWRVSATILVASISLASIARAEDPRRWAATYADAIATLNAQIAKAPAKGGEDELAKKLPKSASTALDALLAAPASKDLGAALVTAGEAALDLDRIDDFHRVASRAAAVAPDEAKKLGLALSRPRFVARGLDGVELEGLTAVADAFDRVLDAYAETFAFAEWSKVPGKKLRLRVHLVPKITAPPHFAPEHPFHSEIDFPVLDAREFRSPTSEGQMLLYGLCHELGHVIAMWGDASREEDHHAWAHYTGLVIVDRLAARADPALAHARDAQWRSLDKERASILATKPGRKSREAVLALLVSVHDLVGAAAIGQALNALDAKDRNLRINRVRYYALDDLEHALVETPAGKKKAREIAALFERE